MRRLGLVGMSVLLFTLTTVGVQRLVIASGATSTPTPSPSAGPDGFDLNTLTTMTTPNKAISLNLPTGWTLDTSRTADTYTWYVGATVDQSIAQIAVLVGEPQTVYGNALNTQPPYPGPKQALEKFTEIAALNKEASTASISAVTPVTIGRFEGFGFTFSDLKSIVGPMTSGEIRLAELPGPWVLLIGYAARQDVAVQTRVVFGTAVKSLEINFKLIPTVTPVPTRTPTPGPGTPTATPLTQRFVPPTGIATDYQGIPQSVTVEGLPVLGSPSARITLALFIDYACPHCASYQTIVHQIIDRYVRPGLARLVIYPLTFVAQVYSRKAAAGLICAAQQGHAVEMSDLLFMQIERIGGAVLNDSLSDSLINEAARQPGLDQAEFAACLKRDAAAKALEAAKLQQDTIPINGVPALLYSIDDGKLLWFKDDRGPIQGPVPFEAIDKLMKQHS